MSINFRLFGVKIRVEFTFLLVLTLMLLPTDSVELWRIGAVCAVHEAGHTAALYLSGGSLSEVILSGFGIRMIPVRNQILSSGRSVLILLAGPAVNLAVFFLDYCTTSCSGSFAMLSLCAGLFNLLPYSSLDGGAILEELLGCRKYSAVILNALRLIPPAGCLAASAILDCFFLLPAAVVTLYFINEYR